MTTTDGQKKWLASNCELVASLDSPNGIYQLFREIRLNPLTQTHRHFFRNNSGDIVGIFRTEAEATQWAFDELESDNWCELCERTMSNDSVRHIIDNHAYCSTCGPQVQLVKRAQLNLGCGCFEYDRNLGDYIPATKCLGEC